jgi:hypothetical protein
LQNSQCNEAEILDLPIKTSVLCLSNAFNSKPEKTPSRKSNGKEPGSAQSLFLDVKDMSSWKGPELERVSKVRLLFRGSELTLESG